MSTPVKKLESPVTNGLEKSLEIRVQQRYAILSRCRCICIIQKAVSLNLTNYLPYLVNKIIRYELTILIKRLTNISDATETIEEEWDNDNLIPLASPIRAQDVGVDNENDSQRLQRL